MDCVCELTTGHSPLVVLAAMRNVARQLAHRSGLAAPTQGSASAHARPTARVRRSAWKLHVEGTEALRWGRETNRPFVSGCWSPLHAALLAKPAGVFIARSALATSPPTRRCPAMLTWLDRLPWIWLLLLAGWMAIAPITPEPHLIEKLRLLVHGALVRPLDILDLAMHAAPLLLVALKMWRQRRAPRH